MAINSAVFQTRPRIELRVSRNHPAPGTAPNIYPRLGQATAACALALLPSMNAKVAANGNPPRGQLRGNPTPAG